MENGQTVPEKSFAFRATVEDDQELTVMAVSYTEAIRKIVSHYEIDEDEIVGISLMPGDTIR